jgi:hypothetical protein
VLQLLVTANVVPGSLILSIQLVFLRSVLQLLVSANIVPSSLILSILMMEAMWYLQEPRGITSQKMAFFEVKINRPCG